MALYRIIAGNMGNVAAFDPFTGGASDSEYVNTNYDPLPTIYTAIPASQSPTVFYDPGYTTVTPLTVPGIATTNTGATTVPTDFHFNDFTPDEYASGVTPGIFQPPADTPNNALPTSAQTTTTPTTQVLLADVKTAVKNNVLPLLTLAGLLLVAVKGDDFLGDKRKLVYMGGLGLLYYTMAKNSTS